MKEAKILVVEDENIVALEIKKRLQKLGYIVPSVASTGEDAISKVEGILPDLVLMDIMLKGEIDGIHAAGEIRKRFNIPVVYLTAYSDEETLQRAKLTEPYGYILKPFEENDLRTTIEIALYRHQLLKDNLKK
ncbi:MAG: response regulator [Methanomethylovorans sp.]|uniref:response regulator n=1 Tax=Methanomethylovorans sp. TaxID=2758717 RepID=UPI000A75D278|nr:response regulator [Methanomethylovorans sp.]